MNPALLSLSALTLGLAACTAPVHPPAAGRVSLVYAGNVDGEIEPCG